MNIDDNVKPSEPPDESWLIIFSDLLALLLTFFVLLFSMNSVQVAKWEAVIESLSQNLNKKMAKIDDKDWKNIEVSMVPEKEALSLPYLKKILEDKLQYDPILGRSSVNLLDDRLIITLPADLIFEKGQSELSLDAYRSMKELGASLQFIQNKITVVGHTDLEPTSGRYYPSNWELSLVRAISIAKMIENAGYTKNIETFGNGPSRFDELDKNIPLDERYLLARRVDVVIYREDSEQPITVSGVDGGAE